MKNQMDIITDNIEYGAIGTTNKEITRNILNEWRGSQKIIDMYEAEAYSRVQNTNIENKTRAYQDEDGHIIQNINMSNIKSKTGRYRKSLKQKLNFALAKPFVISCDNDKYKEAWDNFLNSRQRAVVKRTGKNAINKGIGFSYVWINEEGELELVDVDPATIYPAWVDEAHTELDAIVRDYQIIEYQNQTPSTVYKVEFWDKKIVEKYIDYGQGEGSGDLEVDVDDSYELDEQIKERATIQQTHLQSRDGQGISWDRVPFVFMKSDEDELPLLNECKTDIDGYDMLKSKTMDSLIDDIDAVLVVEGISAEMGELSRARKLVQNSRIMSIDIGGNAHFEKVNTDISAVVQQLDLLKKDILDNTSTVDVTTIEFGSNPSGKAMRTFYEPLNQWANGFESEFRVYFENLKYFFDKWLSWKGGYGTFEELQKIDITFTLDRDMLIDESEIITNLSTLGDEISQETRDELNPYVESHEKEQKRRDDEAKKAEENNEFLKLGQDIENYNNNEQIDKNQQNLEKNNARESV